MLSHTYKKFISLVNYGKNNEKPYFYVSHKECLLVLIRILRKYRVILFHRVVIKSDRSLYYKVHINLHGAFEVYSLIGHWRQSSMTVRSLKYYFSKSQRVILYLGTLHGIITHNKAIYYNTGGLLLFGIRV